MKKMRLIAAMSLVGLGLSGLSGCGELPGGETNDTTKTSISISVNGTAVEANGSVSVDELKPFTLKATVNNGDADDVVSWGSSTPSAFTFSSSTGLETTATANYASSTPITLFAQLQDDASVKTTINVTVNPVELTYKLSVDTSEMDLSYDLGDTFSSDGLVVMLTGYAGETAQDPVEIGSDEYELSIADGTVLETAGQVEVTVTADEYEAQPAKFSITVEDNPLYPLQRNLAALKDENSLTTIEYSNGSQSPTYSSMVSSWNGFALNTGTKSLYQETADGLRKFRVNYNEQGNPSSLTDAGYIYDSYEVSTLTAREMLDMDMATTADVFASLPLGGLKITESNDDGVVYDVVDTSETYDAVLSLSGYSALKDNATALMQRGLISRYSLDVTISAFDDLSTVIEIDYTSDLDEIYSQYMPTSLTAQFMLSTIGSSSLEVYLEGLVEDGNFEKKPAVSDTFKSVLDTIRGGKFFADFAYNGYSNTSAQYVGSDKYNGVIENFGKLDATGQNITEIISTINVVVDTAGKSYKDQALADASGLVFKSTQQVTDPDELPGLYPTEWEEVDQTFELTTGQTGNYFPYEGSTYEDMSESMIWSPSLWNGFYNIDGLEHDVSEYWDKVSESSGTAPDPSDETGESTVDFVSGSYNLYGSLYYKTGDKTGMLDQLTTLRSMSVYFDQYVSALESKLGAQLYNSKVNIEYQLVNGDWSNPYSFITIQTYAGSMGEVNVGYVDQMDLHDFGSASNPTVDSFLELLTDAPTEPQA